MKHVSPEKDSSPIQSQEAPCPPWLCFTFDNPVRRLLQNPYKILKPYIKPGWTVMDVGPGMGFFTIPLAKLVGDKGRVVAADLQAEMLEGIKRRAARAGVEKRIVFHQTKPESIGVSEPVDFCLAFWMVHEVPDRQRFIGEIVSILKPGGLFMIVEPKLHVSAESFNATIDIAKNLGMKIASQPKVFISRASVMVK